MNCKQANDFIMKYFDGNLNDIENAQLKQHLKNCQECNRDFEELDRVLSYLEKESWALPPEDFEIQVMQKVGSLGTATKKSESLIIGFYSLIVSMIAVYTAFVILHIRELNISEGIEQFSQISDAFTTIMYATYGIVDKLAGVLSEMLMVGLQFAGNIASSYYYIFIAMLLMLLLIHKALMNMLHENGGTTK